MSYSIFFSETMSYRTQDGNFSADCRDFRPELVFLLMPAHRLLSRFNRIRYTLLVRNKGSGDSNGKHVWKSHPNRIGRINSHMFWCLRKIVELVFGYFLSQSTPATRNPIKEPKVGTCESLGRMSAGDALNILLSSYFFYIFQSRTHLFPFATFNENAMENRETSSSVPFWKHLIEFAYINNFWEYSEIEVCWCFLWC